MDECERIADLADSAIPGRHPPCVIFITNNPAGKAQLGRVVGLRSGLGGVPQVLEELLPGGDVRRGP